MAFWTPDTSCTPKNMSASLRSAGSVVSPEMPSEAPFLVGSEAIGAGIEMRTEVTMLLWDSGDGVIPSGISVSPWWPAVGTNGTAFDASGRENMEEETG